MIFRFGLAALRIGKSRTLSQATAFDALLALILGSVLARGIIGSVPLLTILSSSTLVGLHWLLSLAAAKSHWFGELVKGRVKKLVSDGVINWDRMQESHISEHDLLEETRLNANLEDVT